MGLNRFPPVAGGGGVVSGAATDITGLLKGNGAVISAAVAGTDYIAPASNGALKTLALSAPAANTTQLSLAGFSLTGSNAQSLVSATGTLNTSGVVDLDLLDITNTASGAGSTFLNRKVGGTSVFKVRLSGRIDIPAYPAMVNFGDIWAINGYSNGLTLGATDAVDYFRLSTAGLQVYSSLPISWGTPGAAQDLFLYRAAADTLQLGQNHATAPVAQILKGANATSGDSNGGDLTITGGTAIGEGTKGLVKLDGGNRAAYDAEPSIEVIRDILISHGLMASP